uniref:Uncharacterized protein n=1 Tax=Arundo donax TaxID=35708 RepID=A0A0A9C067_ARUDO
MNKGFCSVPYNSSRPLEKSNSGEING